MDSLHKFKRKNFLVQAALAESEFFFQILNDDLGAYLVTVDQKGKPVFPEYRYHQGVLRDLLYSLEQIQEKQNFQIEWETPRSQIYLAEHPFLMWGLRRKPLIPKTCCMKSIIFSLFTRSIIGIIGAAFPTSSFLSFHR